MLAMNENDRTRQFSIRCSKIFIISLVVVAQTTSAKSGLRPVAPGPLVEAPGRSQFSPTRLSCALKIYEVRWKATAKALNKSDKCAHRGF